MPVFDPVCIYVWMCGGWGEGGNSEVDLLNLHIMDYNLENFTF